MAVTELIPTEERALTAEQFQGLSEMPPELEWFANLKTERTRREYSDDLGDFRRYVGIETPEEFRTVTRAHVIAWRDDLKRRVFSDASVRRKLSALSSLFNYLCNANAVSLNPVQGVARPETDNNEGKTPAISNAQARALLAAPRDDNLKGKRDRTILATLLYHGIRREELCKLRVRDYQQRSGVMHFQVSGKRKKTRYVEVEPTTQRLLTEYLDIAGHREDIDGPLFRPVKNNTTGVLDKPLHPTSVYRDIVKRYAEEVGIPVSVHGFCVHSLRATAATNALENGATLAEVQGWLGHANVSTTRLYYRKNRKPEDSPSFKVRY